MKKLISLAFILATSSYAASYNLLHMSGGDQKQLVSSTADLSLGALNGITSTIIGYLSGVTGDLQSQINNIPVVNPSLFVAKAGDTMSGDLTSTNFNTLGVYQLGGNQILAVATSGSLAIGQGSSASALSSLAVGKGSQASSTNSIAIGQNSQSSGTGSMQLGAGSNAISNTLQFQDYNFLDSTGHATFSSINGITSSTIAYLSGATSNLQSQINNINPALFVAKTGGTMSGGLTVPSLNGITSSTIAYLSGTTANIQTQFTNLQNMEFIIGASGCTIVADPFSELISSTGGGLSSGCALLMKHPAAHGFICSVTDINSNPGVNPAAYTRDSLTQITVWSDSVIEVAVMCRRY